ncbi:hypothetical protein GCM10010191_44580 [Actinomadura vinacea]|uniref:Peptidase S8/S53 domain-containing protein n=1 Tax=Actinomadura vinacea TaxID=115336 RepID=A0ABN3JF75_9ACTN
MRRWSRVVARSALALLVVGGVASPGSAAAAAKPLPQQWWFTSWGVQDRLWPSSKGQGVTVAVIDTGVQSALPDLSGVVLPGMDAEGGGGDGRTDVDRTESNGHGTAMASLIAAQGRGTGLLGVAPNAKILPVVAQSKPAYAKGIRFAAGRGAKVISLSQAVAGPCPADLQEAVTYALGKDAVVVAGAGNDGNGSNSSMSPANCAGVVAVGAVDGQFRPWAKSQRQSYVTVAGPGVQTSAILRDGKVSFGNGTSDATALTSAAVALVRSKFPNMSNREVVQQVIGSAMDVGPRGKDDQTGFGFIRPYRILNGTVPKSGANPVFDAYDRMAKNAQKTEAPAAGDGPKGGADMASVIVLAAWAGLGAVLIVVMLFVVMRRRKKGRPAPVGPVPGATPSFGAPYPPQGPGPHGPGPQGPGPQPGYQQGYPQQPPQPGPPHGPPHGSPQGPPPGGLPPQTYQDIPQQPPQ